MWRSCVGFVAFAVLASCSDTLSLPDRPVALDPGPFDYQALVSKYLDGQKNRDSMGSIEISPLRASRLAQPGDWMVCARTTVEDRPTYLALFIRENKVIESRLAVLLDECAQQRFQPLPTPPKPASQ